MLSTDIKVSPVSLPGQKTYDGVPFPLVLQCQSTDVSLDAACSWIKPRSAELCNDAERSGTVLFRGFPLRTHDDFDMFIQAFGLENFAYEDSLSNAVRMNKTPRVFTANEAPPDVSIYFHHEMAQTPLYPSKLFFFCEKAAEEGGATPLCRSDLLWKELEKQCPEFAKNCVTEGLQYSNVMPGADDPTSGMGRSWQSTLKSTTREQAEKRLKDLGYTWTWLDDGCLRATTPVLQAVYDIAPGRRSFFNQLIAAYKGWKDVRNDPSKAITFGDGTPLDKEAVATAIRLADDFTFDVPWQAGDVALVDNYVTMHGRRTFKGTRKVLASLVAA